MVKAKSKQKKGKQTNLSKVRKNGNIKKKATTKVRKGKKKTVRRKAAPRPKTTRLETVSGPAAFTEIASEEVTLSTPVLGEQQTIGSTGVDNS